MAVLGNAGDAAKGDQRGRRGGFRNNAAQTNIFNIVKMIMERNFAPVIIFSFSKKDCEAYAMQMAKLDFNTSKLIISGTRVLLLSNYCLTTVFCGSYKHHKKTFVVFNEF